MILQVQELASSESCYKQQLHPQSVTTRPGRTGRRSGFLLGQTVSNYRGFAVKLEGSANYHNTTMTNLGLCNFSPQPHDPKERNGECHFGHSNNHSHNRTASRASGKNFCTARPWAQNYLGGPHTTQQCHESWRWSSETWNFSRVCCPLKKIMLYK